MKMFSTESKNSCGCLHYAGVVYSKLLSDGSTVYTLLSTSLPCGNHFLGVPVSDQDPHHSTTHTPNPIL